MTTRIQNEYAKYLLDFPWQSYATVTFRTKRHDSFNSVNATWSKLNKVLNWSRGFCAVEAFKLGGLHLHYLLADDRCWKYDSRRSSWSQKYLTKAFGWSKCETILNDVSVSLYCSKYVTKDNGEFFFLGQWKPNEFMEVKV